MDLKLLNISSMHSGYLESFYKKYPQAADLSYDDHYNLLMSDTTEFAGSYCRNFRKLGTDAKCVITNDNVLQCKWKNENNIKTENNCDLIFEQVHSFKPDILWIENLSYLNADWFDSVRNKIKSVRLIIAYHCAPYNKSLLEKLKNVDFIITCTPGIKMALESEGLRSYHVYHGFDSDLLSRLEIVEDITKKDLVFSGSLITGGTFHNSRIKMIDNIFNERIDLALFVTLEDGYKIKAKQMLYFLNNMFKKIGMERLTNAIPVFEYGRSPVVGYSEAILRSNHQPLYGIDMYNLFNSAKIVLNMHIGVAGDYAGNMRLFEVTGIGSCLLTDNKRNMTDLFDTGREVVTYDDPEDCINKIKWLLEREDERDKIAHLGHKKTLESHKVYDRCKSIIDIINKEL